MVREPAVAGRFYPADPVVLRGDLKSYLSPAQELISAIACMVPHAGYMYSGAVAGAVFSRIAIPTHCIILCPNHTGRGHPLSLMSEGAWRTPTGDVSVDHELAEKLLQAFPDLTDDAEAHRFEHAIEVELPFLRLIRPEITFVPIAVGTNRLILLEMLGETIAQAVQGFGHKILIIASSDMNHYEDDATTRVKDCKAIDKILALDPAGLHGTVIRESISMCGFGPTVAMLTAAKQLGAKKAELVQYATSGDVSGDRETVVGYAGIVVT
jgi:AmmeMemoRadiSam system protein B